MGAPQRQSDMLGQLLRTICESRREKNPAAGLGGGDRPRVRRFCSRVCASAAPNGGTRERLGPPAEATSPAGAARRDRLEEVSDSFVLFSRSGHDRCHGRSGLVDSSHFDVRVQRFERRQHALSPAADLRDGDRRRDIGRGILHGEASSAARSAQKVASTRTRSWSNSTSSFLPPSISRITRPSPK